MPRTSSGSVKRFDCSIFQKEFTTKSNRDTHVVHKNTGRFECEQCGKTFEHNFLLIIHRRTHTGEMPFRCEICQKRFAYKNGLMAHHLDHHAEKKFKCECGKAFGRKISLKSHLISHSNRRPFKCDQCGCPFKHKSDLKRHLDRYCAVARRSTQGQGQREPAVKVGQPNDSDGSRDAPYDLRTRRKRPNYRAQVEESDEDSQSRSPEEDAAGREFQDSEQSDEEIKGRPSRNDKMITSSLDDRDQDSQLAQESSRVTSTVTELKVVFDVEYRAPD